MKFDFKELKKLNKNLIILAAGSHGRVIADAAVASKDWGTIAFLDDKLAGHYVDEHEVMDTIANISKYRDAKNYFIVGVGDNLTRRKMQLKLEIEGYQLATIVHPATIISPSAIIEQGCVIMPGVVINNAARINKGCIINTSSSIDHDCRIGTFTHISPGSTLAGNVIIGQYCWLGVGSKVINNIQITDDTIVGAGAVVIDNILSPGTYTGVPTRKN